MKKIPLLSGGLLILFLMTSCQATPAALPTPSPTLPTGTLTKTPLPSDTPLPTFTPTAPPTPSPTRTPTKTNTPIPTKTFTPAPTPPGGSPGQIAIYGGSGIELLDTASRGRQSLGIYGTWLAWNQNGEVLAYIHYIMQDDVANMQVCNYEILPGTERCIQLDMQFPSLPFSLSPVNKVVALSSYEKLYLIDMPRGSQEILAAGGDPTWSPDGSMIAFTKDGRIFTMNADGSDQKMIIATAGNSDLTWSPNGEWIAYVSWKNGNADVYTTTLEGYQSRRSTSPNYDGYLAWSPDGNKLAYVTAYTRSYAGLFGDVVVVDVAENRSQQITQAIGATSASPSWSPDGQWLTFGACKASRSEPGCAVVMVKADGSEMTYLTDYEPTEFRPAWRPSASAAPGPPG